MLQLINSNNGIELAKQQQQQQQKLQKQNEQQVRHKLFMENTKHISNYKRK